VDGPHPFTSLLVTNGGVLTHSPAPNGEAENRLNLTLTGDVMVDATSAINANGGGYGSGSGPSKCHPELKPLGWDEPELPRRRKGDPQEVKLAGRLRREITPSLKWIAKRLPMGRWTCVSNLLNGRSRHRCVNRDD
jgi:hypothetical protein